MKVHILSEMKILGYAPKTMSIPTLCGLRGSEKGHYVRILCFYQGNFRPIGESIENSSLTIGHGKDEIFNPVVLIHDKPENPDSTPFEIEDLCSLCRERGENLGITYIRVSDLLEGKI